MLFRSSTDRGQSRRPTLENAFFYMASFAIILVFENSRVAWKQVLLTLIRIMSQQKSRSLQQLNRRLWVKAINGGVGRSESNRIAGK